MWNYQGMPGLPPYAQNASRARCIRCLELIGRRGWVYLHERRLYAHLDCASPPNFKDLTTGDH